VSPIERLRRLGSGARQLRRLAPSERRLFLAAWGDLVAARLRVGVGRIDWVEVTVEKALASPSKDPDRLVALFDVARDTLPFGVSCLPKSLALRRFLGRHGVSSRLRLGVRKIDGEWNGHAWVEREGTLVGDRPELVRQFVPFHETA
jgi:hypothetical protein